MNEDPIQSTMGTMQSLGLDTSPWSLVAAFVFSVVGYYVYRAGKRRLNQGLIWTGVAMWVYPLFLNGALKVWLGGLALSGLAYYLSERGDPT